MIMQKLKQKRDISEILHHLGEENLPFNAMSPPIFQTSIFSFDSYEDYQAALADETHSFLYSRGNNPTVNLVEQKIAALEHGEQAKLMSSGVAAISAAVMAFVKTGDHIISIRDCYTWAKTLFTTYLGRFGVEHDFVDGVDPQDFAKAIKPNTKIIYLESPTSLTFKIQDLTVIAKIARDNGIKTIIDNTWATPLYQNPIDHGIDIVVHSASKYFGGHSDLVAGVIIGNKSDMLQIYKQEFLNIGHVPDPFMAWLILRGMRTLQVRLRQHNAGAQLIAEFLEKHPKVESVCYPFLSSFPQNNLAKSQMTGGAGLFSFRVKSHNVEKIKQFVNSIKVFKRAVSWGGYESLIYANAISYVENIPEDRISLIRIHIGLENPQLLMDALNDALTCL
ncbi:aminotransferase class V-fold PLP-dependent enzyme [Candidatus Lokiarchaeum ossiferum]|uniref:aminotransferase class V-fold PLP-dependent enzyme n=1 Tax=Candidatus Lokiarchaeum ossiferum TaxID=2951803 RepID=UPI00352E95FC